MGGNNFHLSDLHLTLWVAVPPRFDSLRKAWADWRTRFPSSPAFLLQPRRFITIAGTLLPPACREIGDNVTSPVDAHSPSSKRKENVKVREGAVRKGLLGSAGLTSSSPPRSSFSDPEVRGEPERWSVSLLVSCCCCTFATDRTEGQEADDRLLDGTSSPP